MEEPTKKAKKSDGKTDSGLFIALSNTTYFVKGGESVPIHVDVKLLVCCGG